MEFDVAIMPANHGIPVLDSVPLVKTEAESDVFEAAEIGQERDKEERVEIVLESNPARPPIATPRGAQGTPQVAPLGQRFVAALADGLVLLMGFGVFAAIFWAAGGHFNPHPLTLVIFGAIAAFFILAYFGLFTVLGAATPGLLWMEMEVRSAQGGAPTPQESFWRAFGYLISIASLMLGFIWSSVDGDHLSWHDHMSGTYIARIGH